MVGFVCMKKVVWDQLDGLLGESTYHRCMMNWIQTPEPTIKGKNQMWKLFFYLHMGTIAMPYRQTHIHTHMSTTLTHKCTDTETHVHIHTYTHRFMHTHTNIYTCTYTQSRIHTYTIVTYSQAHSTQAYTHKLITMNRYILKYFYILKEDIWIGLSQYSKFFTIT